MKNGLISLIEIKEKTCEVLDIGSFFWLVVHHLISLCFFYIYIYIPTIITKLLQFDQMVHWGTIAKGHSSVHETLFDKFWTRVT